jgi:hypothetical protein
MLLIKWGYLLDINVITSNNLEHFINVEIFAMTSDTSAGWEKIEVELI